MKNIVITIIFFVFGIANTVAQLADSDFHDALRVNSYAGTTTFFQHMAPFEKAFPNDAKVAFLFGTHHYKCGNTEQALYFFTKSITIDASFVVALVARATIFGQKNDLESAISDLNLAVSIQPKNLQIRDLRIKYLLRQKEYDAARRDIDEKIALQPLEVNNYIAGATICALQQQSQQAALYFAEAFANTNNDAFTITIAYAQYLLNFQRFDDVIARYNEALVLDSKRMKSNDFNNLSAAYFNIGDYANALIFGQKAESLAPLNLDYSCNLATICRATHDWTKAAVTTKSVLGAKEKHHKATFVLN